MFENLTYLNMTLAFIGVAIYLRNALACKTAYWRIFKFATAGNLLIIAVVYLMFILKITVDPIVVRLNTTLIIALVIANGILGRSKYGRRY